MESVASAVSSLHQSLVAHSQAGISRTACPNLQLATAQTLMRQVQHPYSGLGQRKQLSTQFQLPTLACPSSCGEGNSAPCLASWCPVCFKGNSTQNFELFLSTLRVRVLAAISRESELHCPQMFWHRGARPAQAKLEREGFFARRPPAAER